jgi:hypothetical protein
VAALSSTCSQAPGVFWQLIVWQVYARKQGRKVVQPDTTFVSYRNDTAVDGAECIAISGSCHTSLAIGSAVLTVFDAKQLAVHLPTM